MSQNYHETQSPFTVAHYFLLYVVKFCYTFDVSPFHSSKVLKSSHFHFLLHREYPDLELDTGGLSLPPLVNTGEVTQSLKMSWNVIKMSWKCQENVMKRSWKYHENFRSRDKYWPMRGQYSGHITSIDQSEASIDQSEGSIDQSEASFHLFASPGGL